ncbi:flagellin N-terminal-like domain-containing protein [Micrococcales bacterium KH10]|nr:flagellin N-terminal-like domain-containing protein [Micrococcales bacterium KH10]
MLDLISEKLIALNLRAKAALADERGEVNIIAIVLLIVVAISLVIIFKDQIGGFVKNIMDNISGNSPEDFQA